MNTAVRAVSTRRLGFDQSLSFLTSVQSYWVGVLLCLLLASAFSVVYVKDLTRRLSNQSATIVRENTTLQAQWSQLLLKKSRLSSQSRIQSLAEQKLNMKLPAQAQMQLLSAQNSPTPVVGGNASR